jgi:pimeloyl-ACP methyl ester carboxylesterase
MRSGRHGRPARTTLTACRPDTASPAIGQRPGELQVRPRGRKTSTLSAQCHTWTRSDRPVRRPPGRGDGRGDRASDPVRHAAGSVAVGAFRSSSRMPARATQPTGHAPASRMGDTRRVQKSRPVDGFRLVYDRTGSGHAVVLLHGWPGDRSDYRDVVPLLSTSADVVVPDLRGFGGSDKHLVDPADQYSADAQARSILGLIEELRLDHPVIGGYDIGSRIAQTIAGDRPDLVRALVVSPPLPGIGDRILSPQAQQEFWYQAFHQLPLAERLLDGYPTAVRTYLRHFWTHWSGSGFAPAQDHLDHLVTVYSELGAFTASIGWYRAGAGSVARSLAEQVPPPEQRIQVPTTILWPDQDPLFPAAWADRVDMFFSDARVHLLDGVGHFTPLEAAQTFAAAVSAAAGARRSG